MSETVWILGINMTKFGKYPDKDAVGLASEAALAAWPTGRHHEGDRDPRLRQPDGPGGSGQLLQKQIGQTGIPVYNVSNACATGATALRTVVMAVKAGEVDMGLAVGVEKLAVPGLLAGGGARRDPTLDPAGRFGAVTPVDGRIGTETMPGVFAQIGMEYAHKYGGADFELFAGSREEPRPLDAESAGRLPEAVHPRARSWAT